MSRGLFKSLQIIVSLFFILIGSVVCVNAQSRLPVGVEEIEFIPGWREKDGTHISALRIRLEDGWFTYWRTPQTGGIPPSLVLRRGAEFHSAKIYFPKPEIISLNEKSILGYRNEVTFPIVLSPHNSDVNAKFRGDFHLGVCNDVCVPTRIKIKAKLDPDLKEGSKQISSALSKLPVQHTGETGRCLVFISDTGLELIAEIPWASKTPNYVVTEYKDEEIWVAKTRLKHTDGILALSAKIDRSFSKGIAIERSGFRITLFEDDRHSEISGCFS